ncbi:YeiH family protein [Paenibacillus sp. HJGM_3]|uniref:YeiH family protein n=1 Tax=Paenibacillus sp. HJGM_3 TaxID=3379816 RepID=UPI00385CED7B
MNRLKQLAPGLLFTAAMALPGYLLGLLIPFIGAPIFSMAIGIIWNHTLRKPAACKAGITFTSKKILQWSIIAMGCGLNLRQVWETGTASLTVTLCTLATAFIVAFLVGKLLKMEGHMQTLVGAGTAICGGSAIAAVAPIIEAKEMQIALSISTIFLYNIVAALFFPPLGHVMGLSDLGFGLWAGSAINDTSSVVAAGYTYSEAAGQYATIVKLTRSTFIIPICIFLAVLVSMKRRKEGTAGTGSGASLIRIIPWFILYFLAASLLHTVGVIPDALVPYTTFAGKYMIDMALFSIGLAVDFRQLVKTGAKPVLLGGIVWISVILVCLAVQFATGKV